MAFISSELHYLQCCHLDFSYRQQRENSSYRTTVQVTDGRLDLTTLAGSQISN